MELNAIHPDDLKNCKEMKDEIQQLQYKLSLKESFFKFVPYLVAIVKIDGTIIDLNNVMAKSLGKRKQELIGSNILDFFPAHTVHYRKSKVNELLETRKPVEFIDKRNNQFYKSNYFPIFEKNNEIEKIIAIVQDITEEKLNEKQRLFNQKNYYELLIENSLDLITVVDKQARVIYESPSLKKLLQFTVDERRNQSVFDHIHPDDKPDLKKYFNHIISKPGLTKQISYRIKDKSGHWHYFESLGNNQLDNDKINGIIINSRDISNRVKEEMEKNAILDNTSEIIAYHNRNHQLLWANKAYQKETGLSLDELVGKKCYHAWGLDEPCFRCPLSKALKTGRTVKTVFSPENQKNWPGDFKTWKIIGDPVIDENGKIIGAIEISYDITQERKASEEIKRTKDHLEKLIHNTSEIIFSINSDFKITLWNKTAENLTGIKAKSLVNKDIRKQDMIQNKADVNRFLKNKLNHKPVRLKKISLKTLFGSNRILSVSTSLVEDEKNQITDIIFICNDITEADYVHGKLIHGVSYLVDDSDSDRLITMVNGLVSDKQKGIFFTRSQYELIVQRLDLKHITLAFLSDRILKEAPTIDSLASLKSYIQKFVSTHHNSIVCIDRTDYLFATYGFKNTVKTLYDINDMIKKYQAILLFRVNHELFSGNEYEILKEEFPFPPSDQIQDIYLGENLFSILSFIYEQNQTNKLIYQKNIAHHFSLSKVTVQKRIKTLIEKDLIFYRKQGRRKNLFITERGKQLLNKKK